MSIYSYRNGLAVNSEPRGFDYGSEYRPVAGRTKGSGLDYQDVKLKIVQMEGYDAHDFNLFDDRASLLWRKPYIDGAVRELTSGDDRSAEQLRQIVEQMMLANRDRNGSATVISHAAHRGGGTVRFDVQTDETQALLRDMRRNPGIRVGPSLAGRNQHLAHARPGPGPNSNSLGRAFVAACGPATAA